MKKVCMIIALGWALAVPSLVLAHEGEEHADHDEAMEMADSTQVPQAAASETGTTATAVEVGNKICPVSGEKVGEHGEIVKFEHEGKVYNLCCAMCKKDFLKDPQKYIEKVNEEMKAGE